MSEQNDDPTRSTEAEAGEIVNDEAVHDAEAADGDESVEATAVVETAVIETGADEATEAIETADAVPDTGDGAKPSKAEKQAQRAQAKAERAERKAAEAKARAAKGPTAPFTDSDGGRDWKASGILAAAVVALVAAVTCLGYFGFYGVQAYVRGGGETVELRDESIDVAEQAIINTLNIDPGDIDGWIKRVQSTMTGEALEETTGGTVEDLKKQYTDAGGTSTVQIVAAINRAAATEVNDDDRTVKVLVFATATAKQVGAEQGEGVPMEFLVTVVDADGSRKVNKVVPLHVIRGVEAGLDNAGTPDPSENTGQSAAPGEGSN